MNECGWASRLSASLARSDAEGVAAGWAGTGPFTALNVATPQAATSATLAFATNPAPGSLSPVRLRRERGERRNKIANRRECTVILWWEWRGVRAIRNDESFPLFRWTGPGPVSARFCEGSPHLAHTRYLCDFTPHCASKIFYIQTYGFIVSSTRGILLRTGEHYPYLEADAFGFWIWV